MKIWTGKLTLNAERRKAGEEVVMGSKLKPGAFDCYANAEPDEPMFILLGRDKHGPDLVERWADLREADGEDAAKVQEARDCAKAMRAFREQRQAKKGGA